MQIIMAFNELMKRYRFKSKSAHLSMEAQLLIPLAIIHNVMFYEHTITNL